MENEEKTQNDQPLIRSFKNESLKSKYSPKIVALLVGVVVLGILSGYLISGTNKTSQNSASGEGILNLSSAPKGTVVGSSDTSTFKDTVDGTLKVGGVEGEGAFHLERPGGDSQNVYLTSSIVDLSKFVGKKIKVWGQTQKAQRAGWLMDVGRVEVL